MLQPGTRAAAVADSYAAITKVAKALSKARRVAEATATKEGVGELVEVLRAVANVHLDGHTLYDEKVHTAFLNIYDELGLVAERQNATAQSAQCLRRRCREVLDAVSDGQLEAAGPLLKGGLPFSLGSSIAPSANTKVQSANDSRVVDADRPPHSASYEVATPVFPHSLPVTKFKQFAAVCAARRNASSEKTDCGAVHILKNLKSACDRHSIEMPTAAPKKRKRASDTCGTKVFGNTSAASSTTSSSDSSSGSSSSSESSDDDSESMSSGDEGAAMEQDSPKFTSVCASSVAPSEVSQDLLASQSTASQDSSENGAALHSSPSSSDVSLELPARVATSSRVCAQSGVPSLCRGNSSDTLRAFGGAAGQQTSRMAVQDKLFKALSIESLCVAQDCASLANVIEEALYRGFAGDQRGYLKQARSVIFNLNDQRNETFRHNLKVGAIKPEQVPSLSAEDMASTGKQQARAKIRQESMEEIQTDWDLKHGKVTVSGMFTCGRCKSNQTTYYQLQTRSSDEPMTTFVTCLKCGKRFRC